MIPGLRPILLTSAVVVVAGVVIAWQHLPRPSTPHQAVAATSQRAEPRALKPRQEGYATSLWRSIARSRRRPWSFAGISYEIDNHDAHLLEQSEDILRVGEVLWPGQYKPH